MKKSQTLDCGNALVTTKFLANRGDLLRKFKKFKVEHLLKLAKLYLKSHGYRRRNLLN